MGKTTAGAASSDILYSPQFDIPNLRSISCGLSCCGGEPLHNNVQGMKCCTYRCNAKLAWTPGKVSGLTYIGSQAVPVYLPVLVRFWYGRSVGRRQDNRGVWPPPDILHSLEFEFPQPQGRARCFLLSELHKRGEMVRKYGNLDGQGIRISDR